MKIVGNQAFHDLWLVTEGYHCYSAAQGGSDSGTGSGLGLDNVQKVYIADIVEYCQNICEEKGTCFGFDVDRSCHGKNCRCDFFGYDEIDADSGQAEDFYQCWTRTTHSPSVSPTDQPSRSPSESPTMTPTTKEEKLGSTYSPASSSSSDDDHHIWIPVAIAIAIIFVLIVALLICKQNAAGAGDRYQAPESQTVSLSIDSEQFRALQRAQRR